jgi:hypothetical protein
MLKSLYSSEQGESTKESLRESFGSFRGWKLVLTCRIPLNIFHVGILLEVISSVHLEYLKFAEITLQIFDPQVILRNTSPERFSPHHVVHFSFRVVKMLNNSFMHIVTYFVMKKAFNGKVFSLSPLPPPPST